MSLLANIGIMTRNPSGGGGTDPYWANVVSLLHFDGTNGSTTYTDEKALTWTATSPASLSTAEFVFGTASGSFTGGYIATPSSSDFVFGTGDFTIECWIRFTSNSRGYVYSNNTNNAAILITPNSGLVEVYGPGSHVINTAGTGGAFALNTWYAIALTRAGNTWRFFTAGVQTISVTDSRSWGSAGGLTSIGRNSTSTPTPIAGFVDEFRITKGVARYTAGYTPTGPFPNS